nr:ribosomal protein L29 [Cryptomonas sp. NIES-345]BDA98448.1 ribosomal protein L29 [Cryptomonas sp. NIES-1327]
MSFTRFEELRKLNDESICEEILSLKKELFTLRLKKATRQSLKPHLFTRTTRKLSQLLTLQSERARYLK